MKKRFNNTEKKRVISDKIDVICSQVVASELVRMAQFDRKSKSVSQGLTPDALKRQDSSMYRKYMKEVLEAAEKCIEIDESMPEKESTREIRKFINKRALEISKKYGDLYVVGVDGDLWDAFIDLDKQSKRSGSTASKFVNESKPQNRNALKNQRIDPIATKYWDTFGDIVIEEGSNQAMDALIMVRGLVAEYRQFYESHSDGYFISESNMKKALAQIIKDLSKDSTSPGAIESAVKNAIDKYSS